ncbi:unnamed protein product [Ilex paraguariensis]|uniref:Uncharacterized protein n=1 Tax=Ilex paraguariensis TaxID=185542 RepID=A0ABC8REH9_9AQUA
MSENVLRTNIKRAIHSSNPGNGAGRRHQNKISQPWINAKLYPYYLSSARAILHQTIPSVQGTPSANISESQGLLGCRLDA